MMAQMLVCCFLNVHFSFSSVVFLQQQCCLFCLVIDAREGGEHAIFNLTYIMCACVGHVPKLYIFLPQWPDLLFYE